MKKMALFLASWFCLFAWIYESVPLALDTSVVNVHEGSTFILPASIKEIEEAAFEGTAMSAVMIPDSAEIIGDRAFANNKWLQAVHVSESVMQIGEHAFAGSDHVTVYGEENSYAASWSRAHNIAFIREDSGSPWITKLKNVLCGGALFTISLGCVCPDTQTWRRRRTGWYERSMRPQDRPELYVIDYRFP